jgi:flagellar protein FliS
VRLQEMRYVNISRLDECRNRLGIASSPHRVIQMLMEAGLSRLKSAAVQMRRGEIAQKGESIGFLITAINGLQASLDAEAGGEIAANLDGFYDYMTRTLVVANLDNDADRVDEIAELLCEIKSGWDGIDPKLSAAR